VNVPPCIFLAVVYFFSIPAGFGQIDVSGKVVNDESAPLPGVLVQLLLSDSSTIHRHTRTDATGAWSINGVEPGVYLLKMAYFGSETHLQAIDLRESRSEPIRTVLYPKAQQLGVVQISADKVGLVLRGDTTFYNIDVFTDSTEYDLKDILNKLPGIEVDDGGIKYNGKRVDVALVEGQDIFGKLHKQMTESIKAEDVKGVQVMKRYKDGVEQLNKPGEDKVALNVELTDEAKNKLNGDAGVLTNATKHLELTGTAYKAGGDVGFTALVRGNNTGQPTLAFLDILAMLDLDDPGSINPEKINDINSLYMPLLGVRQNNDLFAFARIVSNPVPHLKTKASITFTHLYRLAERISGGVYTNDNTPFAGFRREEAPGALLNLEVQNTYQKNSLSLQLKTPVLITRNDKQQALVGLLDSNEIRNTFDDHVQSIAFTPALTCAYRADSNQTWVAEAQYQLAPSRKAVDIQSVFPVFGLQDTLIDQAVEKRRIEARASLGYQKKVRQHQVDFTTGVAQSQMHFDLATTPLPDTTWANLTDVTDKSWYAQCHIRRNEARAFRYGASYKAEWLYRTFGDATETDRFLLPTGQVGFTYDISKTHHLHLSAATSTAPPDVANLIRVNQIQEANSLLLENVDSNYLSRKQSIDLSYSNKDPYGIYYYSLKANYSVQYNSILHQPFIETDYIIRQSLLTPAVNAFTWRAISRYNLKKWKSLVSVNVNGTETKGYTAIGSLLQATALSNLSAGVEINHQLFGPLTVSAGAQMSRQLRVLEPDESRQTFLDQTLHAGFQYKAGKWFARSRLAVQQQSTGNTIWLLDAEVEHRLKAVPLRLRIVARNALNLKGNVVVVPDWGFDYVGLSQYRTIGGQIMAGVSYVF